MEHLTGFEYLRDKGLISRRIIADGNCFFRALSDQVYGTQNGFGWLRNMVCDYMCDNQEDFAQFLDETDLPYQEHVDYMRKNGEWADHLEINVAAKLLRRDIRIYHEDTHIVDIAPNGESTPSILLAYYSFGHYESVHPYISNNAGGEECVQTLGIRKNNMVEGIHEREDDAVEDKDKIDGDDDTEVEVESSDRSVDLQKIDFFLAKQECVQPLGINKINLDEGIHEREEKDKNGGDDDTEVESCDQNIDVQKGDFVLAKRNKHPHWPGYIDTCPKKGYKGNYKMDDPDRRRTW